MSRKEANGIATRGLFYDYREGGISPSRESQQKYSKRLSYG